MTKEVKNYQLTKFGKKAERIVFSKTPAYHELNNLYEIQTDSFEKFLDRGIRETFEELGKIMANNHIELIYKDHKLDTSKIDSGEINPIIAVERKQSYDAPLYVTFTVVDHETGESIDKDFYLCDLPLMTKNGTFVFNGAERVVVSQLSLSPGFYLPKSTFKSIKRNSISSSNLPQIRKEEGPAIMFEISDNVNKRDNLVDVMYSVLFVAAKNRDLQKIRSKVDMVVILATLGLPIDYIEKNILRSNVTTKNSVEVGIHKLQTEYYEFLKNNLSNTYQPEKIDVKSRKLALTKMLARIEKIEKNINIPDSKKLEQLLNNEKIENETSLNELQDPLTILKNILTFMKNASSLLEVREFGRKRLSEKLSINQRLHNKILAEDVYDENGNLVLEKGTHLRSKVLIEFEDQIKKGIFTKEIPIDKKIVKLLLENDNSPQMLAKKIRLLWNLSDKYNYLKEEDAQLAKIIREKVKKLERDATVDINTEKQDEVNNFIKSITNKGFVRVDEVRVFKDFVDYNKLLETGEDLSVPVIAVPYKRRNNRTTLDLADLLSIVNFIYLTSIYDEFSANELYDEMDEIANKQVKPVGVLLKKELKSAINKKIISNYRLNPEDSNRPNFTLDSISFNSKAINSHIRAFFGSDQLSQFMDQINPLSELTHKRRLSGLGKGGISKDDNRNSIRDVTGSHYGRICPIETPEGWNIGVINSLSLYARLNEDGIIMAPHYKIVNRKVDFQSKPIYLHTTDENRARIVERTAKIDQNDEIIEPMVPVRYQGEPTIAAKDDVTFMDYAPQQAYSVSTACIPFLERDDAKRALMGANMQRQAVPVQRPESPLVGTGMEYLSGKYSGAAVIANNSGKVTFADASRIEIEDKNGDIETYYLKKFYKTNQGTCQNQHVIVKKGQKITKGDIIADGYSMQNGELALGKNPLVAFMTWEGYNFEDAIIISDRLVKDDVYTSIHMEVYETQSRKTDLGNEEITRDIPHIGENQIKHLDDSGVIIPGTEVEPGTILVGKVTPKGESELTSEEKLLYAIFGEKSKDVKDNSLRMPNSGKGVVQKVVVLSRENGDTLPNDVDKIVRVYVAERRKIKVGDKMAGRHGNKGIVSVIVPTEDMPYMEDGTPVDIILNPLGVPSRMNIGQVLELHLGMAARNLDVKVATPIFDGINDEQLNVFLKQANVPSDGKYRLFDGRTGEAFDREVSVGVMYMLKLNHMVDDKMHARSTGPYSVITHQPLGGKAQFGGQRLGEMEVWAFEAYGAANILQEMLTVKSDDIEGRNKMLSAVESGREYEQVGVPETFNVLVKNLEALAVDVELEYHEESPFEDEQLINDEDQVVNEVEFNEKSTQIEQAE